VPLCKGSKYHIKGQQGAYAVARFAQMTRLSLLLALLALFAVGAAASAGALPASAVPDDGGLPQAVLARMAAALRPAVAGQVRIVQHFSVRITPGGPMVPPDVVIELEQEETPPRFRERPMGKCVEWGGIEAVRGAAGNRLLLFLHDSRVVSVELDKACEARAFDSGFLFARTTDSKICVNRDVLQARSGVHCQMKRLRALVPTPARRGP